MLRVQSDEKQILWVGKVRVQESWPRRVFNVLHGKLCTPSWTWQARFTWPQVTDGYKFYRDTRGEWQTGGGEGGNLVSSWFCWFWRRETEREREDESFKTEGGSFIPAPCSSKERGLGICLTGQRTGRSKLKDEYKEEAMPGRCGNIVSCGIRDGPLKTSRLSVKKRGKEAGGKWRSGRGSVCWLSPSQRSCYELVVNLSIL